MREGRWGLWCHRHQSKASEFRFIRYRDKDKKTVLKGQEEQARENINEIKTRTRLIRQKMLSLATERECSECSISVPSDWKKGETQEGKKKSCWFQMRGRRLIAR